MRQIGCRRRGHMGQYLHRLRPHLLLRLAHFPIPPCHITSFIEFVSHFAYRSHTYGKFGNYDPLPISRKCDISLKRVGIATRCRLKRPGIRKHGRNSNAKPTKHAGNSEIMSKSQRENAEAVRKFRNQVGIPTRNRPNRPKIQK